MKRVFKYLSTFIAIFLVAVLTAGIIGPVKAQAASKKTVRVTTQKELDKALKKSNVGTIILRTQIHGNITISSKKAKKKNIIIDAPFAAVENKTKFKTVELIQANKYIENVSGNTITAQMTNGLIVAKGKSIKKLTVTFAGADFTIRKGASIKNLSYNYGDSKSTYDKKTRILTYIGMGYDGDGYTDNAVQVLTLDKSGRVLTSTYIDYEGKEHLQAVEYDSNGNKTAKSDTIPSENKVVYMSKMEYDKNDNLIYMTEDYFDGYATEYFYKYDADGRLISNVIDGSGYGSSRECKYDSNGWKIEEICFIGPDEPDPVTETHYFEYDKNGYLLREVDEYSYGTVTTSTYEYDKSGNNTYFTIRDDYDNGDVSEFKYKYEYDEYGDFKAVYVELEPGNWVDATEYAG